MIMTVQQNVVNFQISTVPVNQVCVNFNSYTPHEQYLNEPCYKRKKISKHKHVWFLSFVCCFVNTYIYFKMSDCMYTYTYNCLHEWYIFSHNISFTTGDSFGSASEWYPYESKLHFLLSVLHSSKTHNVMNCVIFSLTLCICMCSNYMLMMVSMSC